MAKPLGPLAKTILSALADVGEVLTYSPIKNRRDFSKWCWRQIREGLALYDSRFYQTVRRLEAKGLIRVNNSRVELSPEGYHLAQQIDFSRHTLATPPWDGIWRVIIWDIPETARTQRNRARRLLKRLAVVQIQQSVWVTPHPCREEVQALRAEVGIDHGLLYLEAHSIEGDLKLRQHFHVS